MVSASEGAAVAVEYLADIVGVGTIDHERDHGQPSLQPFRPDQFDQSATLIKRVESAQQSFREGA
jgi:hypothetical protein